MWKSRLRARACNGQGAPRLGGGEEMGLLCDCDWTEGMGPGTGDRGPGVRASRRVWVRVSPRYKKEFAMPPETSQAWINAKVAKSQA